MVGCRRTPSLLDVGGFTDGERAAYLAEATGATLVLLWGFDFERAEESDAVARDRKLAKLGFARDLACSRGRAASDADPHMAARRDSAPVSRQVPAQVDPVDRRPAVLVEGTNGAVESHDVALALRGARAN